jgi:hypothetical protein
MTSRVSVPDMSWSHLNRPMIRMAISRCDPSHLCGISPGIQTVRRIPFGYLIPLAFILMGFSRFLKHSLTHQSRQNTQERNTVQLSRKGGAGGLIW